MANQYTEQIKQLEREVLELKTAQELSAKVQSYLYSFIVTDLSGYDSSAGNEKKIRIYFDNPNEIDVFTEFTSFITCWPQIPTYTQQDIKWDVDTGSAITGTRVYVMSNVPIIGAAMVD